MLLSSVFAVLVRIRDNIGPAAGGAGGAAGGLVSYRSGISSRLRHPCVLARGSRVVKPAGTDNFLLVTGTRTAVAASEISARPGPGGARRPRGPRPAHISPGCRPPGPVRRGG